MRSACSHTTVHSGAFLRGFDPAPASQPTRLLACTSHHLAHRILTAGNQYVLTARAPRNTFPLPLPTLRSLRATTAPPATWLATRAFWPTCGPAPRARPHQPATAAAAAMAPTAAAAARRPAPPLPLLPPRPRTSTGVRIGRV